MKTKSLTLVRLMSTCLLGCATLIAQQGTAPAKVAVNAPFAQQMIVKEKMMHPEIQKLGLHAVPPGQTQNVIVASNLPEKIGKVSAASDMEHVASGAP